ncbi:MAG: OsmC family protein [Acidobacteria bacterium]|nr:OsmC family protein [Acidobacteriota bacterium]
MVHIEGTYVGVLKTELLHGPSGARMVTAAPLDNEGDGSSFSPTDLVASALGACMMTILGIIARREGIDLTGASFRVEKHMQSSPRRIASLPVTLHLPGGLTVDQKTKLERGALTCPVHRSLLPEIDKPVTFVYAEE